VSAIPLWHVNQFSNGVMEGMGGGPNPAGMRNVIVRSNILVMVVFVILSGFTLEWMLFLTLMLLTFILGQNLDRTDAGYSPLWNLFWATAMPINYSADQFSNAMQGTSDNGFEFFTTPMYVNCPDIGLVGQEMNPLKSDSFEPYMLLGNFTSYTIIGTSPDLILLADQTVTFVAVPSNTTVGETTTNMMGGYEYDLEASDIPDGTTKIVALYDGVPIRTVVVATMQDVDNDSEGTDDGTDYLDAAPATVYEDNVLSPQNM
jgi:hypothetical protein